MRNQGPYSIEEILQTLCQLPEPGRETGAGDPFLQFMDEMPGGFLIYRADQSEELLYANQGLLRMFQCGSMEELRAMTDNSFRGLVHPDDRAAVQESIQRQIAASKYDLDYVEYRACRRDGSVRWIEDYGHFVRSEAIGDIFYVFLGDATDKKAQMDKKARRQTEVIEGLSVSYESICYVDLDQDIVTLYRLSGRNMALFEGRLQDMPYSWYTQQYITTWVHPEDRTLVDRGTAPNYIREKLAEHRTYYFNYRVQAGEELQYIQLRVVNADPHQKVKHVVLGYRRVDEEMLSQMKQQALLAEALAKANLAVNSQNTFLSNMSHDMRTPLHAMFGFTSLAKLNLNKPQEVAGYLDRVETAGRQLLDMIENLLRVSCLSEAGGVKETECDLRQAVREIYDFLHPQAQEKNLAFHLDCTGLTHPHIYADGEKLRQMLTYLVNNAVTYTKSGGSVTITVSQEETNNRTGVYHLTVEDTGVGISPEFLDRIFEPFTRERNSTLSGIHGIGLGLTIAKSIVDMMGGTIQIKSAVGKGTVFTTTFHFRLQPRPTAFRKSLPIKETAQRILLAEDNEINREIEIELLEQLGFIIDPAEDGQIALDKVKASPPGHYDLVLMDLQMPVMDGWQASEAIRALPDPILSQIPIIALSANVLPSDQKRSKECGIDAHLNKPMDLPLLLATIEEITGLPRPS